MTVEKLKIDHGQITIDYSVLLDSFRISTADKAPTSLYSAAADVAILARIVLCLNIEGAGFHTIAFSNGDRPATRLILTVATAENDPAKIACPKIDRGEVIDFEKGIVVQEHPKTVYEHAVQALETEIKEFVKGKRLQMALPFEQSKEEQELEQEVAELISNDRKVIDFSSAAASAQ